MLITLIDVISCENPKCRDFAKKILCDLQGVRSYYCQVCGEISYTRAVDAEIVVAPERYKVYLRKLVLSAKNAPKFE